MISQTPRSQLSREARKKAAYIYKTSKWISLCSLILLAVAVSISIRLTLPNLPEWINNAIFPILLAFAAPAGETLALWRMRRLGLERFLREDRVLIGRARLEFNRDSVQSNRFLKCALLLSFPLLWAIIFFILQLSFFDFQVPADRKDSAIATTFIAVTIFFVAAYIFPKSLLVSYFRNILLDVWGTTGSDYLRDVPWSRVAKVREERTWKNSESPDCHLVFLDENDSILKQIQVPASRAEEVFQQIKTHLDNPHLEAEH